MSQIPQDIIDRVRDSADIVDVVSQYVDLKQRGPNFFGLCPFHNEKTPSFSVSSAKQIYYCFGVLCVSMYNLSLIHISEPTRPY